MTSLYTSTTNRNQKSKNSTRDHSNSKEYCKRPSDWRTEKGCFVHFTTAWLEPDPLVDFLLSPTSCVHNCIQSHHTLQ